MSKYLVTADWHGSLYSSSKRTKDGIPERIQALVLAIEKMNAYALKNEIDYFVISGDVFSEKLYVYNIAANAIKGALDPRIKYIIVEGNHDRPDAKKGESELDGLKNIGMNSTLGVFKDMSNVELVMCGQHLSRDGILFLPYYRKEELLEEIMKHMNGEHTLISHFGVFGALTNTGFLSQSVITPNDLTMFSTVILGDYHKPQHIKKNEVDIYYTGAPVTLTRGDANDEKRFIVYDTDSKEVLSVPIVGIPMHKKFEFMAEEYENLPETEVVRLLEEKYKEYELALEEGHLCVFKTNVDRVSVNVALGEESIQEIVFVRQKGKEERIKIDETMDADEYEQYLTVKGVPEKDHKEYLEVFRKVAG